MKTVDYGRNYFGFSGYYLFIQFTFTEKKEANEAPAESEWKSIYWRFAVDGREEAQEKVKIFLGWLTVEREGWFRRPNEWLIE